MFRLICFVALLAAVFAQSTAPPPMATTLKQYLCNDDQDCDRHCAGFRGFCENNRCQHCEAPTSTACSSERECLESCRHAHHLFGVCYRQHCRCNFG